MEEKSTATEEKLKNIQVFAPKSQTHDILWYIIRFFDNFWTNGI